MARSGDLLRNPVTGHEYRILQAARDTGGVLLDMEVTFPPGASPPPRHLHPRQDRSSASGRIDPNSACAHATTAGGNLWTVMIIVAGRLYLRPGTRERFLSLSADAMAQARVAPGCRDFVVAADPLEADRVNVYEAWASREALAAFRGSGPGDDLSALIVRAEVAEHVVTPAARP